MSQLNAHKHEGKVVLITGGTSGIGFATAQRFVAEGAFVYITGRRPAELEAAVKRIGKNVVGIQGDVAKLADLDRLFGQIKREKGHLDVIFANAGFGTFVPFAEVTEEHFDQIFNVNVRGLLFTAQKALPLLKDGSSIVLNASITGFTGPEAFSVYSASKAAVRSFARSWSNDLKARKIRVNAVSPGMVPTEAYTNVLGMTEDQTKAFGDAASARMPLGRVGKPDEIAKAVSFLAGDDSSYVTGIDLVVDGGYTQI